MVYTVKCMKGGRGYEVVGPVKEESSFYRAEGGRNHHDLTDVA